MRGRRRVRRGNVLNFFTVPDRHPTESRPRNHNRMHYTGCLVQQAISGEKKPKKHFSPSHIPYRLARPNRTSRCTRQSCQLRFSRGFRIRPDRTGEPPSGRTFCGNGLELSVSAGLRRFCETPGTSCRVIYDVTLACRRVQYVCDVCMFV